MTQVRAIERAIVGRVIGAVSFEPSGVTVEWVEATDVKANGCLLAQSLFVPHGDQYDDELDAVLDAVQLLLADVLTDLPGLPVASEGPDDTDDGDELGMGE